MLRRKVIINIVFGCLSSSSHPPGVSLIILHFNGYIELPIKNYSYQVIEMVYNIFKIS